MSFPRTSTARRFFAVVISLPLALLIGSCGSAPASGPGNGPKAGMAPSAVAPAPTDTVLPAAEAYIDAVNGSDLDALVNAFTPEGEIVDVVRRIRGQDAIRTWADNEVIGGTLRVDSVTTLSADTQRLRVYWAPSGSSGWAADYTFTTRGDQILVADLQYAR